MREYESNAIAVKETKANREPSSGASVQPEFSDRLSDIMIMNVDGLHRILQESAIG